MSERWPKLKPCPFCGEQPLKDVFRGPVGPVYFNLLCCRGLHVCGGSRKDAAAKWNTREGERA